MKLSHLATFGLLLLSGCQARQPTPPSPSLQPASANSAQLQAPQQELYFNFINWKIK